MAVHRKTLVIFGAGGDLSTRLLLPGLGQLLAADRDIELELIGASNAELSADAWQDLLRTAFAKGGADPDATESIVARSRYFVADATDADDLRRILAECDTRARPVLRAAAGRHRGQLPGARHHRAARGHLARSGEAVRHRPGQRRGPQPPARDLVPEDADPPGRPLPRQVHRAQPARPALREPDLRAGLERGQRREGRDRLRREARAWRAAPATTTRRARSWT